MHLLQQCSSLYMYTPHETMNCKLETIMDYTNLTLQLAATIIVPIILVYLKKLIHQYYRRNDNEAPEPAGAWPVIGHLHLLNHGLPHITLGAMADRHGPIFILQLGIHRTLVVSNQAVAKECLTTNDKAFSSRPKSIAFEIMGYNNSLFEFAPYGPYWRELRKITILELLSQRRLESLKHVWISEIDAFIGELHRSTPLIVDMKKWFNDLTINIVVRLIVGKVGFAKEMGGAQGEALEKFFKLANVFLLEDGLPFMRWFDFRGRLREMRKVGKELDCVLQVWLDEHKLRRSEGEYGGDEDFMDVMLSVLGDSKICNGGKLDADTVNKATCLNLISGGTDTIMITLTWAISLLLNHPHELKKTQVELEAQVGNDRHVDESDIKNLVYLQAIIKETLRLYPPAPLSDPHESTEEATVGRYCVPSGTRIIINLWKIQRDPSIWPDPSQFQPNRFLTTHVDTNVWGNHYELIPFGSGRRSCPAVAFSLQVVTLTLARLLQGFDLTSRNCEPIDMTESVGLTNAKATPVYAAITPRIALFGT